jgi:hypothetical protein
MNRMRRLVFVLAAVVSLAATATAVADSLKFKTKLSGDQEVPPAGVVIDTQARGKAEFKLSKDGTELRYKLSSLGKSEKPISRLNRSLVVSDR